MTLDRTSIGAYLTICEEDAVWIDQYLSEMDRVGLRYAVNFDRCSNRVKKKLKSHPRFVGATSQDDPKIEFTEQHKQGPFNLLVRAGFSWALNWDADETWELEAGRKLDEIANGAFDYGRQIWVNLWGDREHVRVDGPFNRPARVKLYNLQNGRRWYFDHPITNGCKLVDKKNKPIPAAQGETDLVCIHHGLMTRGLRLLHKERWDRIYTTAVGANPYGIWNYCCDEDAYPPEVVKHDYR